MYSSFDLPLKKTSNLAYVIFKNVMYAFLGSFVLWVSAKIQVPFWPVPMTMQTYVIFVIAALYDWRLGLATVLLYLTQGALGLPVFAGTPEKGLGLAYMVGPTGGYLFGFILATVLIGVVSSQKRTLLTIAAAITLGKIVILGCGVVYLSSLIGWSAAVQGGLLPFFIEWRFEGMSCDNDGMDGVAFDRKV